MRNVFALFALLFLAGCASTGVRVAHVAPIHTYSIPSGLTFEVIGDHEPTVSAARQALASTGMNSTIFSHDSESVWKLRTDVFVAMETTRSVDTFCGQRGHMYGHAWYPRRYYFGTYGFGPGYSMACPGHVKTRTAPVRTVIWTAEEASGRILWQASAREDKPAGPPMEPSMRLAKSLREWLDQQNW